MLATLLRRLGHTAFFRRVAPILAGPVDRFLHRISGGRLTVSERVAPMLFLHHRGRRSGREYRTPLFYVRRRGAWLVVGTNFGRESQPAWAENLLATPEARIEVSGRWHEVHARLVSEEEWCAVWPVFTDRWPAYDTYLERASHREIRMFALEQRRTEGT
ncbi:MAG: nitroreductase family deazaflavin-dependent oxidoreductase [Nitriliruptorales bacterium]|nr:nitroreductase family deazaflavin-dependent oxidoreductase [Nitriliruptorales bacterium]